ncbi:MAG: 4-hydroxy-3-methylbut-2-enyl diphosphate reductase [Pseudomonadota bacterium]
MKVYLAKSAGFCMGVKRAVSRVGDVLDAKEPYVRVSTYGSLIHNRPAVDMLKNKSVNVVNNIDDIDCDVLIIRSHGIPPQERKKILEKKVKIIDTTCPKVAKVQSIIKKHALKGYNIIIAGDKDHSEVKSLMGFSHDKGFVVASADDIRKLPDSLSKVCFVSQTTQNQDAFEDFTKAINEKYPEALVFNTICYETSNRQNELKYLSLEMDAILVIGSKESANSQRLYEIARELNNNVFFAEDVDDIDFRGFAKFDKVGITAGASTPNWIIDKFYSALLLIKGKSENSFKWFIKRCWALFVLSRMLTATAAVALTYANSQMLGIKSDLNLYISIFCYVLFIHAFNDLLDRQVLNPFFLFFQRKVSRGINYAIYILAFIVSCFFAYQIDVSVFVLLIVIMCTLFLISYKKEAFYSIKKLPASKNIVITIAWIFLTLVLPLFISPSKFRFESLFTALIFTMTIIFARSMVSSYVDYAKNKIVGSEVLSVFLGEKKFKLFAIFLIVLSLALFCTYYFVFMERIFVIYLLLPLVVWLTISNLKVTRYFIFSLRLTALIDLLLIFAGLLSV